MEIGTKALGAFLERINADPSFSASDLTRLGENPTGPVRHRYQILSQNISDYIDGDFTEMLSFFVGSSGLWVLYIDDELNFCAKGPEGEKLVLPDSARQGYLPRECKIHGVCNGLPVVSIVTESVHSVDSGLAQTRIVLGDQEIACSLHPFVAIRNEDTIFYTTQSPDYSDHANHDLVIWHGGEIKIESWIPNSRWGVNDLLYGDNAVMVIMENQQISYILDHEPCVWKTRDHMPLRITNGRMVGFESKDYPIPNPLLQRQITQVAGDQFALLESKDDLWYYRITKPDPTSRHNDYKNGLPTPKFEHVSNLVCTNRHGWIYFGYHDGMLYKMKLGVKDDRVQWPPRA